MPKKFIALVIAVYFFVGLILYSPVIKGFFVSDDFDWIGRAKDLSVQTFFIKNADGVRDAGVYRPITSFSFWVNYKIHKLNPIPYHLTNIIFFIGTAFLIYVLLKKLKANNFVAYLAGVFFLIIPSHPEAVSWISGRGDVLTTFFYLLALISYIHFRENNKLKYYIFSLVCFVMAILAKEMAMSLPAIIFVYEILWQWKKENKNLQIRKLFLLLLPFCIILAAYFVARYLTTNIFFGLYSNAHVAFKPLNYLSNLWTALAVNFFTGEIRTLVIAKIIWRYQLILSILVIPVIYFGYKKFQNNCKIWLFAISFFILSAAPILSLSFSKTTDEGDRFAYLSSVAVAIILAIIIAYIKNLFSNGKQRIIFIFLFAFCSFYLSSILVLKNTQWRAASDLAYGLLMNFEKHVNFSKTQGVVILGMPDNISGAQIWRNGWHRALSLYYPAYRQDLLVAKLGFNIPLTGSSVLPVKWEKTANGYLATATKDFFVGSNIDSADYLMTIEDKNSKVIFIFAPAFWDNLNTKPLTFLAVIGQEFKILDTWAKK